jgi:hypothetical protein
MWLDRDLALDFFSPLAVIAILAWSFGMVRGRRARGQVAPVALGLAFGLVAMLQMHLSYAPVAGLLVDLRTVPVALAGAFLGGRGLLACLSVALAARYQLGGVEMMPGLLGIGIAGIAGAGWNRATRSVLPRGPASIGVLACGTSLACLVPALLPPPLGPWYAASVAPWLMCLHVASVWLLAILLERERHLAVTEARGAAGGPKP